MSGEEGVRGRNTRKRLLSRVVRSAKKSVRRRWALAWRTRGRLARPGLTAEANRYLDANQERLLFILGNGRSGTQLISSLLDGLDRTLIFHEPNFDEDVETMDLLRRDPELAAAYWREFRAAEVYRRWSTGGLGRVYGEVNGTLRYQAPAIRRLYPASIMLLLARDGRGFVRSVMGWPHFYAADSRGAYALAPLDGDPFFADWAHMSRFERICWSWRDGNEFVMRVIPQDDWLQVERITTEFEYFAAHVAARVGIDVPRDVWSKVVSARSKNASKSYAFPAWDAWERSQRDAFVRICGDTMARLGYSL